MIVAVEWKLNGTSLAALSIERMTRRLQNQLPDELAFDALVTYDGSPLLAWGAEALITRAGVPWFRGRNNTVPSVASEADERMRYRVVGPWWWLEQVVFQQEWMIWSEADGHVIPKRKSRVILCQTIAGDRQDSRLQIIEAIDWAIARGAPLAKGLIDSAIAVEVPWEECVDISCAEVVRKMLRWSPDAVCWFDYSAPVPTLNITKAASMTAAEIAVGGTAPAEFSGLTVLSREDLQVPGVLLRYEQTHTVDGECWCSVVEDSAGDVDDPRAIVSTVELSGPSLSYARQKIVVETWPVDLKSKAFWADNCPALQAIPVAAFTITSAIVNETGGAPDPAYPRYLTEGSIQDWMLISGVTRATEYTLIAEAAVVIGGIVKQEKFSFRVWATDLTTKTYSVLTGADMGEPLPVGVAAKLYASWNRLQWQGQIILSNVECPLAAYMGRKINLTGGRLEWAAMAAVVVAQTDDIDTGETTVEFGPAKSLGMDDLLTLLRTLRSRKYTRRDAERGDGKPGHEDVGAAADGKAPKHDPENIVIRYDKISMASTTGTRVRTLNLDPNEADDTAAHVIQPRVYTIYDHTAGTFRKVVGLFSEPFGDAVLSPVDVSVQTDERYLDPDLEHRVRTIKVLSAGTEGEFHEVVEFEECPEE